MANEKRLIDANAIPWEEHYVPDGDTQWEYKKELCVLKPVIDAMPTVDAVEVVHGEWIRNEDDECYWYTCSECAEYPMRDRWGEEKLTDYCPNCGAKMDGDGNV